MQHFRLLNIPGHLLGALRKNNDVLVRCALQVHAFLGHSGPQQPPLYVTKIKNYGISCYKKFNKPSTRLAQGTFIMGQHNYKSYHLLGESKIDTALFFSAAWQVFLWHKIFWLKNCQNICCLKRAENE